MKGFFYLHLDSFGFSVSMLCALHCALMPIALTFSTLSGIAFLDNPLIELSIIVLSCALALTSLLPCYFRHHRRLSPVLLAIVGFLLIGISRILPEGIEVLVTPIGAVMTALSHFANWRQCRSKSNKV